MRIVSWVRNDFTFICSLISMHKYLPVTFCSQNNEYYFIYMILITRLQLRKTSLLMFVKSWGTKITLSSTLWLLNTCCPLLTYCITYKIKCLPVRLMVVVLLSLRTHDDAFLIEYILFQQVNLQCNRSLKTV